MAAVSKTKQARIVPVQFARAPILRDAAFEAPLAAHLKATHSQAELLALYDRVAGGSGDYDMRLRRAVVRALAKKVGQGVVIGRNVVFRDLATISIGDGTFIGDGAVIQGRRDGRCRIGRKVWIGPQSYIDGRDLVIEDDVGWAPGARALGSYHTGLPLDAPVIATDLVIKPIRVRHGADIGTGAMLLPGITIGKGAVVGAGAVVTRDVPANAIAAGVPAKVIGWRDPKMARKKAT